MLRIPNVRGKWIIGGIAVMIAFVALYLFFKPKQQRGIPQPLAATPATPTAPPATTLDDQQQLLRMATAHRGEGIEHTLVRQLRANPKEFGFRGNPADKNAVKWWAGGKAHLLARGAGYVDWKFGAEIRVRAPDKVAYLLSKDATGKITITESEISTLRIMGGGGAVTYAFQSSRVTVRTVAESIPQSQFLGWPGNIDKLPAYEYRYTAG